MFFWSRVSKIKIELVSKFILEIRGFSWQKVPCWGTIPGDIPNYAALPINTESSGQFLNSVLALLKHADFPKIATNFKLTHLLFHLPGLPAASWAAPGPAGCLCLRLAAPSHPRGAPGLLPGHRASSGCSCAPRAVWNELCGNRAVRSGASPLACQHLGSSGRMLGLGAGLWSAMPVPGYPDLLLHLWANSPAWPLPVSVPRALPAPSDHLDSLEGTGPAHVPTLSVASHASWLPCPHSAAANPQPHHPSFPESTKVKAQHKIRCVQKTQQPSQTLWLSKRGNCNKDMILLK